MNNIIKCYCCINQPSKNLFTNNLIFKNGWATLIEDKDNNYKTLVSGNVNKITKKNLVLVAITKTLEDLLRLNKLDCTAISKQGYILSDNLISSQRNEIKDKTEDKIENEVNKNNDSNKNKNKNNDSNIDILNKDELMDTKIVFYLSKEYYNIIMNDIQNSKSDFKMNVNKSLDKSLDKSLNKPSMNLFLFKTLYNRFADLKDYFNSIEFEIYKF